MTDYLWTEKAHQKQRRGNFNQRLSSQQSPESSVERDQKRKPKQLKAYSPSSTLHQQLATVHQRSLSPKIGGNQHGLKKQSFKLKTSQGFFDRRRSTDGGDHLKQSQSSPGPADIKLALARHKAGVSSLIKQVEKRQAKLSIQKQIDFQIMGTTGVTKASTSLRQTQSQDRQEQRMTSTITDFPHVRLNQNAEFLNTAAATGDFGFGKQAKTPTPFPQVQTQQEHRHARAAATTTDAFLSVLPPRTSNQTFRIPISSVRGGKKNLSPPSQSHHRIDSYVSQPSITKNLQSFNGEQGSTGANTLAGIKRNQGSPLQRDMAYQISCQISEMTRAHINENQQKMKIHDLKKQKRGAHFDQSRKVVDHSKIYDIGTVNQSKFDKLLKSIKKDFRQISNNAVQKGVNLQSARKISKEPRFASSDDDHDDLLQSPTTQQEPKSKLQEAFDQKKPLSRLNLITRDTGTKTPMSSLFKRSTTLGRVDQSMPSTGLRPRVASSCSKLAEDDFQSESIGKNSVRSSSLQQSYFQNKQELAEFEEDKRKRKFARFIKLLKLQITAFKKQKVALVGKKMPHAEWIKVQLEKIEPELRAEVKNRRLTTSQVLEYRLQKGLQTKKGAGSRSMIEIVELEDVCVKVLRQLNERNSGQKKELLDESIAQFQKDNIERIYQTLDRSEVGPAYLQNIINMNNETDVILREMQDLDERIKDPSKLEKEKKERFLEFKTHKLSQLSTNVTTQPGSLISLADGDENNEEKKREHDNIFERTRPHEMKHSSMYDRSARARRHPIFKATQAQTLDMINDYAELNQQPSSPNEQQQPLQQDSIFGDDVSNQRASLRELTEAEQSKLRRDDEHVTQLWKTLKAKPSWLRHKDKSIRRPCCGKHQSVTVSTTSTSGLEEQADLTNATMVKKQLSLKIPSAAK